MPVKYILGTELACIKKKAFEYVNTKPAKWEKKIFDANINQGQKY